MFARSILCAAALVVAAPAFAQATVPNPSPAPEAPVDRGYDKDTPKSQAINAQEAPVTRALNNTVDQATTVDAVGAQMDQQQYQEDLAAYHDAVMANHADAMKDQRRFDRQQRAYADAMAQWRAQTDACNKGKLKACKLPTPNPADYY